MAWIIVKQKKSNPHKLKVCFNRAEGIKLHETRETADLLCKQQNEQYGKNLKYFVVEVPA